MSGTAVPPIRSGDVKNVEIKTAVEISDLEKRLLPHLYGDPHYRWSWDFFNDLSEFAFLSAANQIGKSTVAQKKIVHLATETSLWPKLWRKPPKEYWYLYPSKDLATMEFNAKWEPDILPRGKMKEDKKYGWHRKDLYGTIHHVTFNSGVTIYFKSYEQSVTNIQASSVNYILCDEELPVHCWPEVNARRFGVDGIFNMVFTATLGQRFWYETMECIGKENERFKNAFKRQVSMYDCLKYYKSKQKTPWTKQKIAKIVESCQSASEVQRRVYGKFVLDETQFFTAFNKSEVLGELRAS